MWGGVGVARSAIGNYVLAVWSYLLTKGARGV